MQRFRQLWVGIFLILLTGCSSLKPVGLPQSPAVQNDKIPQVKIGEKVKILLTNGESLMGLVVSVSPVAITINGDPNYGRWEQEVRAADIEKIELVFHSKEDKQNNRAAILAVVTGLVIALFLGLRNALSQLD